jgi:hypothetical protein
MGYHKPLPVFCLYHRSHPLIARWRSLIRSPITDTSVAKETALQL